MKLGRLLALLVASFMIFALMPAFSLTTEALSPSVVYVDASWDNQSDVDDYDDTLVWETDAFNTIQAAVAAVELGGEVIVLPGTYSGNIVINKNLTLISLEGYEDTIIEGDHDGAELGTIVVTNNTTGVQIGDIGQGFTIIGIDGPKGIEKAAIYFQGAHSGAKVIGNKIMADGDSALMSEWNAAVTDFIIDSNILGGQTFAGDHPAGEGTNEQFDIENVPRQLVVMGGGSSGTNTQRITFTNNIIEGVAGGLNIDGKEQGNTLVTIDANDSVITGNTFQGVTARWTSCLRARRPSTISGNIFYGDGLTSKVSYMYLENQTETTEEIAAENTFVPTAAAVGKYIFAVPVYNITQDQYYRTIQEAIDDADAGDEIAVEPGTYEEILTLNTSLTLLGPNAEISPNAGDRVDEAVLRSDSGHIIANTTSDIEITIKGFSFSLGDDDHRFISQTSGDDTTWNLEKNIFETDDLHYVVNGHFWFTGGTGLDLTFKDNYLTNYLSNGLMVASEANVTIKDNVWEDYIGWALNLNNVTGTISNNTIRDASLGGIIIASSDNDIEITHNYISVTGDADGYETGVGVNIYHSFAGTAIITNNTFANNRTAGVWIRVEGETYPDLTELHVEYNLFEDNYSDITNNVPDEENIVVSAPYNWWGSPSEPNNYTGNVHIGVWALNPEFTAFASDNHIGDATEPVPVYDVTRVVLYLHGLANGDDLVIESRYGEYSITIPLDAIPEDIDILGIVVRDVNWWTDWLPEWIKGEDVADAPEGFQFMGKVYRFVMADASDGPPEADDAITQFAEDITMVFYFDPDEIDDPDLLDVYWFDGDAWVALDGVVDMEAGTVTVEVNHWSDFVLMEGEDPVEEEPVEEDPEPETPETGTGIMLLIPFGLLALAGGVLIRRKV